MTINELIQVAHSQAKAKGFWDKDRNTGELLMLIVSECGEALEAHRKGRMGDLAAIERDMQDHSPMAFGSDRRDGSDFEEVFKRHVKDSFPDELADIVIRIADFLGSVEYVDEQSGDGLTVNYNHGFTGNVGESLMGVVHELCATNIDPQAPDHLIEAMWSVSGIARAHDIDLWRHIELKLAYNMTRPALHGKQY